MQSQEGTTSICDPVTGSPLFYTNGLDIYDASTNIKFNATTMLGGSSSTQSATIVPKPGAANTWLVFTANTDPGTGTPGGLNYYTVTGTPGAFSISAATNLLSSTQNGEGIVIVGSTNAAYSYWVVVRERLTANYLAYPITTAGAVGAPVSSSVSTLAGWNSYIGTLKANVCQTKVAATYYNNGITELMDFNASTGVLSGTVSIAIPHSYGLEFSNDGVYLYITQLDEGILHQYNIGAATDFTQASWDRNTGLGELGQLQLAPDNKIYVAITGGGSSAEYIGVINSPTLAGNAANFVMNAIQVNTVPSTDGYSYRGLPTFPKSLVVSNPTLFPGTSGQCVSTSIPLSFSFGGSVNPATISWTAAGGGQTFSPGGASSTAAAPSVSFSSTGAKTITLSFNDNCGRAYTKNMTLTSMNPLVPAGSISCGTGALTLTATGTVPADYPNYTWYDAASGGNVLGVGSPVTLNNADFTHTPTSVWVEVASS
ncbi:MAG: hypothetical protein ACJ75J_08060, partial [Cytophagaceae bacterium]